MIRRTGFADPITVIGLIIISLAAVDALYDYTVHKRKEATKDKCKKKAKTRHA